MWKPTPVAIAGLSIEALVNNVDPDPSCRVSRPDLPVSAIPRISKRSLETACSNSARRAVDRMGFVLCVHTQKREVLELRSAMLFATGPGVRPFVSAPTWVTGILLTA